MFTSANFSCVASHTAQGGWIVAYLAHVSNRSEVLAHFNAHAVLEMILQYHGGRDNLNLYFTEPCDQCTEEICWCTCWGKHTKSIVCSAAPRRDDDFYSVVSGAINTMTEWMAVLNDGRDE